MQASPEVQGLTAVHRKSVALPSPVFVAIADEAWLTVREVAGRLKVSTATVYKLIESGAIEHVRVSNAIRVRIGAVGRYLASSKSA